MARSVAEQNAQCGSVLQGILHPRELAVARGGVYSTDEARPHAQDVSDVNSLPEDWYLA